MSVGPNQEDEPSASVVTSILTYGIAIWASALQLQECQRRVYPVGRQMALRVTSAFRTVSRDAAHVISGLPPIEIQAEDQRRIYQHRSQRQSDAMIPHSRTRGCSHKSGRKRIQSADRKRENESRLTERERTKVRSKKRVRIRDEDGHQRRRVRVDTVGRRSVPSRTRVRLSLSLAYKYFNK